MDTVVWHNIWKQQSYFTNDLPCRCINHVKRRIAHSEKKNLEKSRNTWALLEQMAICEWSKIIFQLKGQATRSGFGVDALRPKRHIVWPHPKCFGTSIILECVTSVKIILRHPSIQARPPKFFAPSSMQIFPNMAAFVRDKCKKEQQQQELYTQT